MAFPTGWQRRVAITVDNTKVAGAGTFTDFPIMLSLDNLPTEMVDASGNSAQDGGGDIRFSSDSAGATPLACEIVDFHPNATAGSRRCEIWVKVPSLSGSADTTIYAWYKPTSIKQQPAPSMPYGSESVWTSSYKAVHHLNDAPKQDATGLWLIRPRAVEYNGSTYVAYLDYTNANIKCAKYTHSTGQWTAAVTVASAPLADGHCAPTIMVDAAGKLNVFWGSYTSGTTALRVSRSTNAEDVSSWGAAVNVSTTTGEPTYPVCVQLSGGTFVCFWRLGSGSANYKVMRKISADNGATWSNEQTIVDTATTTKRPYFTVRLGQSDRIHLAYHILVTTPSVLHHDAYYLYTDDGGAATSSWKAVDGTAITLPIAEPTTTATGLAYDTDASWNNGGYLMGMCINGSNAPQILMHLAASGSTDEVSVLEYSSSAWNVRTVISSEDTEVGAVEVRGEGDIQFVSGTTFRAIVQINVSSRWEVREYETTNGTSWSLKRNLTASSTLHNTQPQYVYGSTGPMQCVWWSCSPATTQVSESYGSGHDLWFSGDVTDDVGSWAKTLYAVSTSFVRDSTQYHNNGTKKAAAEPASGTGKVGTAGKAQTFDGTDDYIDLGADSSMNITGTAISVSAWIKPSVASPAASEGVVTRWDGSSGTNDSWLLWRRLTTLVAEFYVRAPDGLSWINGADTTSMGTGSWIREKGIYDGANVSVRRDTTEGSTKPAKTDGIRSNVISTYIGSAVGGALNRFGGDIDEVQLKDVGDSADWSDTEYNNQNSPSTFATAGAATNPSAIAASYQPQSTIRAISHMRGPTRLPVI